MHRHDLNLIADYASGALDDTSRAKSLVESCETCHSEYQLQRDVRHSLNAVPPASLTESERSALRRDLWTELRSGTQPPERRSRIPFWYRLSFGAAAVVLVAGVMFVYADSASDDSSEAASFDAASATTSAGAASAEDDVQRDSASPPEEAAPSDGGSDGAMAPEESEYLPMIEAMRQAPAQTGIATYASQSLESTVLECLNEAGLADHDPVGTVGESSRFYLAIPPGEVFDAETPISVVDATTCELIHIDP